MALDGRTESVPATVMRSLTAQRGLMLVEKTDLAHASSKNVVVNMFHELEPVIFRELLKELLTKAWEENAVLTSSAHAMRLRWQNCWESAQRRWS